MKKVLVVFLVSFAIAGLVIGVSCGRQIPETSNQSPSLRIYDVKVSFDYPFSNEVIIEWKTDKPSLGMIEFGETTSYGSFVTPPSPRMEDHKVRITDLDPRPFHYVPPKPEVVYHFRIRSSETAPLKTVDGIVMLGEPKGEDQMVFSEDYTFTIPKIIDSDNDGYSDEFEINIAKTDPLTPDQRYTLLFGGSLTDMKPVYEFLTEKARISPENILVLFETETTGENLENGLNQIAEKITANDIFCLIISAHGRGDGFFCVSEDDPTKLICFPYWLLDQYLDKIKSKATIVIINACFSGEDTLFNALGDENRVIVTSDCGVAADFFQALGNKMRDTTPGWQYVFGKPAPPGSFGMATEENPGIIATYEGDYNFGGGAYRALWPWDKLAKKSYSSVTEVYQVYQVIDRDGNGYISIGEALGWVNWIRSQSPKEFVLETAPGVKFENPCRMENLSLINELYFGHYTPKELRQ